jgi:hypothetical protein
MEEENRLDIIVISCRDYDRVTSLLRREGIRFRDMRRVDRVQASDLEGGNLVKRLSELFS